MSGKNYHASCNLTHNNGQILFMTDKFVSRFSQIWEQIFKNGFEDRIPHEFYYLEKLLTICSSGRKHDSQVITSGRSKTVLDTLVCTETGRHGYQNDLYYFLSSFPILFRS